MFRIVEACNPRVRNRILYDLLPVLILLSLLVSRGSAGQSFVHFLSVYVLGMAGSRYRDQIGATIIRDQFLSLVLAAYLATALVEYHLNVGTMTSWNYWQKILRLCFFWGCYCVGMIGCN